MKTLFNLPDKSIFAHCKHKFLYIHRIQGFLQVMNISYQIIVQKLTKFIWNFTLNNMNNFENLSKFDTNIEGAFCKGQETIL